MPNEVRVDIPVSISDEIEVLYSRYNGYLAILEYLARVGSLNEDNAFFDKKWNEALRIYIELEQKKKIADATYCPDKAFRKYRFDFINHQMVYTE